MGCGLYTGLACPSSPAARGKRKFSATGATRACENRALASLSRRHGSPRVLSPSLSRLRGPQSGLTHARPERRGPKQPPPAAVELRLAGPPSRGPQAAPPVVQGDRLSSCAPPAGLRTRPRLSSSPRAPPPAPKAPSPEAPPAASAEQPGPRLRRGPAPTTARPRRATRAHHRDSTDNIRHPPSPDRCSTAHTDSRYSAR